MLVVTHASAVETVPHKYRGASARVSLHAFACVHRVSLGFIGSHRCYAIFKGDFPKRTPLRPLFHALPPPPLPVTKNASVYLPTLLAPSTCYKVPIAVGYTCVSVGKVGHFTALVGIEGELRHLPLVDEHGYDLPVR